MNDESWGAVPTVDEPRYAPTPEPTDGLTPRQRELRDGSPAPVSDEVRERRREQVSDLEVRHAQAMSWLAELERVRAHLASAPCGPDVIWFVDTFLATRVARVRVEADGLLDAKALLLSRVTS